MKQICYMLFKDADSEWTFLNLCHLDIITTFININVFISLLIFYYLFYRCLFKRIDFEFITLSTYK